MLVQPGDFFLVGKLIELVVLFDDLVITSKAGDGL